MTLQSEMQDNKTVVTLPDELTIYTVGEIKEALTPLLYQGRELELNLANIAEIDSAGLQLLIAAKKVHSNRVTPSRWSGIATSCWNFWNFANYPDSLAIPLSSLMTSGPEPP
ncbi:STAS domain-containing protein [Aeromonas jandaei]|uniref:STAS domain-containing protein n=1 Tax=Aeromonas jandaei TaxID=650 RepID=UPI003EC74DBF